MSATRVEKWQQSQIDDAFAVALQRAAFSAAHEDSALAAAESVASAIMREAVESALWEVVAEAASAPVFLDTAPPVATKSATIEYVEVRLARREKPPETPADDTFSDEGGDDDLDDDTPPPLTSEVVEATAESEPDAGRREDEGEEAGGEATKKKTKKKKKPQVAEVEVAPAFEARRRLDEFVGDDGVRRVVPPPRDDDDEFDEEGDDEEEFVESPRTESPKDEDEDAKLEAHALAARRALVDSDLVKELSLSERIRRNSFAEMDEPPPRTTPHLDAAFRRLQQRLPPQRQRSKDDDSVIVEDADDDVSVRYEPGPDTTTTTPQPPVARVVAFGDSAGDAVDALQAIDRARPEDAVVVARLLTGPLLSEALAASLERWLDRAPPALQQQQQRRQITSARAAPRRTQGGMVMAATAVVATKLLRYRCGCCASARPDEGFFDYDDFDRAFPSLLDVEDDDSGDETPVEENEAVAGLLDETLPSTRRKVLSLRDEYLRDAADGDTGWSEEQAVALLERSSWRFDACAAVLLRRNMRRALAALLTLAAADRSVAASVAAVDALARGGSAHRSLALRRVLKPRVADDVLDDASSGSQRAPLCVALLRLGALTRQGHAAALEPFAHLLRSVDVDASREEQLPLRRPFSEDDSEPPSSRAALSAPASLAAARRFAAQKSGGAKPPWDAAMDAWLFEGGAGSSSSSRETAPPSRVADDPEHPPHPVSDASVVAVA